MEEQYYCAALLYAGCEGHGPPHLQLQLRGQGLHSQLWWDKLIQNVVIPPTLPAVVGHPHTNCCYSPPTLPAVVGHPHKECWDTLIQNVISPPLPAVVGVPVLWSRSLLARFRLQLQLQPCSPKLVAEKKLKKFHLSIYRACFSHRNVQVLCFALPVLY